MRKKKSLPKEKDIETHVVAVMGFVQKGDKYLIAKRSSNDLQAGGEWSIPGGKVGLATGRKIIEKDLAKEIKEEVGIEIEDEIIFLGNDAFFRVSEHHVIALTFLCKWKRGVAKPLEDQEEIKWATLTELKSSRDFPSYMRIRINDLEKFINKTRG